MQVHQRDSIRVLWYISGGHIDTQSSVPMCCAMPFPSINSIRDFDPLLKYVITQGMLLMNVVDMY